MALFGQAVPGPSFLPSDDDRGWVDRAWLRVRQVLGAPAERASLMTSPPGGGTPADPDQLWSMICALQEVVGQRDVDLELTIAGDGDDGELSRMVPLGDPRGHLMHTFARKGSGELVLRAAPAIFRQKSLMLASVARELGRMGLHLGYARVGDLAGAEQEADVEARLARNEAEAEIAGIALGMGIWVVNGAYVFENACCGGGCGIDLRSLRTGLSMPEAAYALALDSRPKGLSRFWVARQLEPTQRAALRANWGYVPKQPLAAIAGPGAATPALSS